MVMPGAIMMPIGYCTVRLWFSPSSETLSCIKATALVINCLLHFIVKLQRSGCREHKQKITTDTTIKNKIIIQLAFLQHSIVFETHGLYLIGAYDGNLAEQHSHFDDANRSEITMEIIKSKRAARCRLTTSQVHIFWSNQIQLAGERCSIYNYPY